MSALALWHLEVEAGDRTIYEWDDLHYAACKEAEEREFQLMIAPLTEAKAYRAALETIASGLPVIDRFPALEAWRRQVLEDPEHHWILERAAAWEFTAIGCEDDGDIELAADAYRMAERVILEGAA
jgi:hypothetical protein